MNEKTYDPTGRRTGELPITIPRDLLSEFAVHQFEADASELRMKPGQFPLGFDVFPKLGNGLPFTFVSRLSEGTPGVLESVLYRQNCGCVTIRVWNT